MTLKDIAEALEINCENDIKITGLNTLIDSDENELTFLENKKNI